MRDGASLDGGVLVISLLVVLIDVPSLVEVNEATEEAVKGVFRLHLNVHSHEEGHEEQHPAGERHDL